MDQRQKTQTELAEELELAVPTVLEHLEHLTAAGLVQRVQEDIERKWKYYKLTKTGRKLISKSPINVVLILAFSIMVALASFLLISQNMIFFNNSSFTSDKVTTSQSPKLQQTSEIKNSLSKQDTSSYDAMNSISGHQETTASTLDRFDNNTNISTNKSYIMQSMSEKSNDGSKLDSPKESILPELTIFGIAILIAGTCIGYLVKKS